MSRSEDVKGALSRRITCAPGTVTEIPAVPGQLAQQLKLLSGGTLEIGGPTMAQAAAFATYASGGTFGAMYPLSTNEIYSWNNSGTMYLWASGATCVVALINGRSAGFEA